MEQEETVVVENNENKEQSFDELLKNPKYQSDFDKKIAKALETAKTKWQEEANKERDEATKLAKMSEVERYEHELSKANDEKQKIMSELNAFKLKGEVEKIAKDLNIDSSLLDVLDYSKETAESAKQKLELLATNYNKAVEKGINEKLKQTSPTQVQGQVKESKTYNRSSY